MICDSEKIDDALYTLWKKNQCNQTVTLNEVVEILNDLRNGKFRINRNVFCFGIPNSIEIQMYVRQDTLPFIRSVMSIMEEYAPDKYKGEIPPIGVISNETMLLEIGDQG
jgi:hypothetical protein